MKRIAIIGANSFLAKNFIETVVQERLEYRLTLYDITDDKDYTQFEFCKTAFGEKDAVDFIDYDVDIIMVFMGRTGTLKGFEEYRSFIEVNEIILLDILNGYVKSKSKALIIYPSSRLIFKSDSLKKITEVSERECKSVYAITKQAAENYLKVYGEVYGIRYVIMRICTPIGTKLKSYGNYGTFELFMNQAKKNGYITLYGDGEQRKTFTHMDDICRAFSLLIDKGVPDYNEYNLGGQELSMLEIASRIAEKHDVVINREKWPELDQKVDGGTVVFDSSRFDAEFSFKYIDIMSKEFSS